MKNKYNCVSLLSIAKTILLIVFVAFSSLVNSQTQAPSIQTGVTFQWLEPNQPNTTDPATIESVTIDDGTNITLYNTFVVPSDYELTRLGPGPDPTDPTIDPNDSNKIYKNTPTPFVDTSNDPNWDVLALEAFQDKNLNHYFSAITNGQSICTDFTAANSPTQTAQKQTIFYSPSIPANEDGILAVTERNANNCFHIGIYGTPVGGGAEQLLGQTFVLNTNALIGPQFGQPNLNSDYWKSGRVNENNGTIGIALFYLSDIVPTGSNITKIEFTASTVDHGDGKFFLLQKYAVDQQLIECLDETYNGDLRTLNNAPVGSTYSITSLPDSSEGTLTLNPNGLGEYTFVPNSGFTGEVNFEYELCLPTPNTSVCDQGTVILEYVDLPPEPTFDIDCNSTNNFSITITSPLNTTTDPNQYEYSLDGGTSYQSSTTFNNIPEGSYTLKVRSTYTTCERTSSTSPIVLSSLEASISSQTNLECFGEATGQATVTPANGTAPYTYLWDDASAQTTATATGLVAGTYNVTVTDANGCTANDSVTITQPASGLTATIEAVDVTNVACFGEATGQATVTPANGTAPYTYLWDDASAQTTATATGLVAGTYNVTVTDDNGCTANDSVTITQPASGLTATIEAVDVTNVACFGEATGQATVTPANGTAPYTYLWDDASAQTTATATGLVAGTYTVIVTDDNGCTANDSVTITQPASGLTATIEAVDVTNVACFGEATGQATVTPANGTAPYTYLWDDASAQTTATATGLVAGTYNVTVTDDNGCTANDSVTITQPASGLTATIEAVNVTNVACFGEATGQATVTPANGTAPYTYLWDDASAQTTATATGLVAGTYNVTVTDANGCTASDSVTITQPALGLTATIEAVDVTNVACFGEATGQATVTPANGTAPYTYLWDDANAQTTATATGLVAGTYNVTVTDANGCTASDSVTITQPALGLTATTEAVDVTNVACFGEATGQATVTPANGTAPYTYLWDDASAQTTATATGLVAGTYNVTVTDDNGCTANDSVTITQPASGLTATIEAVDVTNVACFGEATGQATVTPANGTAPYTYLWDDASAQTTATATGLVAGTYNVTVTDANGCTANDSVTITQPASGLTATIEAVDVTNVACFGEATGQATVTPANGTAPYTYLWDDASAQTTATATGLVAGTYTVIVTDDNGCTANDSVTITQPASGLTATIEAVDVTNVACFGEATGQATVTPANGTAPYTYLWDDANAQTTATATGLVAGTYNVTVTDANGCTASDSITILDGDGEAPTASNPQPIDIECLSDLPIPDISVVIDAVDNVTVDPIIAWVSDVSDNNICAEKITRTYSVTDNCGNQTLVNQTITVEDNTPPIIDNINTDNIEIECGVGNTQTELTTWLNSNAGATATDSCSTITWRNDYGFDSSVKCDNGAITVTFTATDVCGNESKTTATYLIKDTTAPVINNTLGDLDATLECSDTVGINNALSLVPTATDDCSTPTIKMVSDVTTVNPDCPNAYTQVRIWNFTDGCGNTSDNFTQTIIVEDNTPPVFVEALPGNITVECDEIPNAETITATDNCGDALVEIFDVRTDGTCPNSYDIERTWTATDECGLVTTHTQLITVQDTTAPVPTSTFDETLNVSCTDITDAPQLEFTDNCSSNVIVVFNETNSFDENELIDYEIVRTWTVRDTCNNEAVYTQTLFVALDEDIIEFNAEPQCFDDGVINLNELEIEGSDSQPIELPNLDGTWEIISGDPAATLSGNIFDPSGLEISETFLPDDYGIDYEFAYTTTVNGCISITEITMNINAKCVVLNCGENDIEISKAVTPNDDFINDFFYISGIKLCGYTAEVKIFNRWGALIFESNQYPQINEDQKNDFPPAFSWEGTANKNSVGNAQKVPNGTYYYIIKLKDPETGLLQLDPITGPVYLGTK